MLSIIQRTLLTRCALAQGFWSQMGNVYHAYDTLNSSNENWKYTGWPSKHTCEDSQKSPHFASGNSFFATQHTHTHTQGLMHTSYRKEGGSRNEVRPINKRKKIVFD